MRMDNIGYHHKHDNSFCIDRPYGSGDWLLLIIKSDSIFRIDNFLTNVKADSCIIFTPDYPQFYKPAPQTAEYFDDWIHFEPDFSESELLKSLSIPLNCPIYLRDISAVSNIVRSMCHEFHSVHLHKSEIVDLYFRILIYKLHEKIENTVPVSFLSSASDDSNFIWLRECIFNYPEKPWNIDNIASELSLSRSRFQHLYSQTFGVSFIQDIITSRVHHATELLGNPHLSIEKISEICGYTSTSYFIRQFKKVKGITPSQYRKSIL